MIEENKKEIQPKKKGKNWYTVDSTGEEDYNFIIQSLSPIVGNLKEKNLSLAQVMNVKSAQVSFKIQDVKSIAASYTNSDDEEMKVSDTFIKTLASKIQNHVLDVGKGYRLEVLLKLFSDAGYKITTRDKEMLNKDVIKRFEQEAQSPLTSPNSDLKLKTKLENESLDFYQTIRTSAPLTQDGYYSPIKLKDKPSNEDQDEVHEREKEEEAQKKLVWRNTNISPTNDLYAFS